MLEKPKCTSNNLMFWLRTSILKPGVSQHIPLKDFEEKTNVDRYKCTENTE